MAELFFTLLSLISGHNFFKKAIHCIGLSMSSLGRALALNSQQVPWFNSQHYLKLIGWGTHSCNSSSQRWLQEHHRNFKVSSYSMSSRLAWVMRACLETKHFVIKDKAKKKKSSLKSFFLVEYITICVIFFKFFNI